MKLAICIGWLASAAFAVAQCPLPTSYNWTSTGELTQPRAGLAALRDFTSVPYQGKTLIYGTTYDNSSRWGSMTFSPVNTLAELGSAAQLQMNQVTVAPLLFFFAPKNIWVLVYQWGVGSAIFAYRTSSDPTNPNGWSVEKPLFTGSVEGSDSGPLDPAIVGDKENMYLFFAAYSGKVYRASMPIGKFPSNFGSSSTIVMSDTRANFLEGVQVYTIKGEQRYLMLVDAIGTTGRFIRSFTATSLSGNWTPNAATESNPFAGKVNTGVTWTNDVSQGDLVKDGADQTRTVDLCNLQVLYQGKNPNTSVFLPLPWRPALLTLKK